MTDQNALSDFPPESFTVAAFCDSCGHQSRLDRAKVPQGVTVQQISRLLRCSQCGQKTASIRIIYTGAGGFQHS